MLAAIWAILLDSAVYILVGFFLAGLLQAWINRESVIRHLGGKRKRSVFLATLIGAPLPLCSCSVLPAAMTLRRKGASKGSVLSFLVSTPETGVTSIALTYALLGPVMAIVRPIAACITAITAGLTENFLDRRYPAPEPAENARSPENSDRQCPCPDDPQTHAHSHEFDVAPPVGGPLDRLRGGLRYAFRDMFDDIFGWIMLGVTVAAAIQTFLPAEQFQAIFGNDLIAFPLMLVIGMVLYVCAEATTPIAAVFILKGMSPGAALVLLLAGPATNIGTMGVLLRNLGRRTVMVYLSSIAVVAVTSGLLLNTLVDRTDLGQTIAPGSAELFPAWLKSAGAVAFLALGLLTAVRQRYLDRLAALLSKLLPLPLSGRGLAAIGVFAALLGYGLSGFTAVQPGEVGVHKRFGAIQRSDLGPGLHFALPWPIERIDRVPVRPVRRLLIGFRADAPLEHEPVTDLNESWSLVGDENIVDLKCAIHWRAAEGQAVRFRYGVADAEQLVRATALGAIREALSGASIHTAMTAERRNIESEIESRIQRRLDGYECGIAIDSVRFLYSHAPPDVHAAFRDVASALEDQAATIDRALAQESRILPAARAGAVERRAAAEAYADRTVALARGQAQRFVDLVEAYAADPYVMRRRMYFEMLDKVLPRIRKYIKPDGAAEGDVEIWFTGGAGFPPLRFPAGDRGDLR